MPEPSSYYAEYVTKIGEPDAEGWAPCACPFHEGGSIDASVNLRHGGFTCTGCGCKADMVSFHQRITGSSFKEAVRDLLGLGVSHAR